MPNSLHPSAIEIAEREANEPSAAGPRKLVRPRLAEQPAGKRAIHHHPPTAAAPVYNASHAEVFYFQKQMQAQTTLVFVLEDGVHIEGVIEWYDLQAIKVRHTARTLIYKSSIKYIYKAGETRSPAI